MICVSKDELFMITEILKQHVPTAEVRAFGSRTNGKNKHYSDLDLAVVAPQKLTFNELGELREAFEQSELPFRVDVLDYKAIRDDFKQIIDASCEAIL